MAPEGKGTKRTALAAALPATTEAGKNKKSKSSKTSTTARAPIEPEPALAPSTKSAKNRGSRKATSKPLQKSPLAATSDDEDGGIALEQPDSHLPIEKRAKKKGKKADVQEQTSTEPVNGAKEPTLQKKKGPSTVNFHAEKIKKLLGQKEESSKLPDAPPKAKKLKGSEESTKKKRTGDSEEDHEDQDDEDVDQARDLLKGFDSDNEDPAEDEGFDKDGAVSGLPHYKKTQKKLRNAAQKGSKDGPGVVYVGRIPHGFYENEMRQYFSQFGTITKLRLSRNRKTGRSKHFAFLEFDSLEVAKIVAETMDNYLMFGHILKCKFVEHDALHPETFKGANKRFRVAPYNKMEKRALEAPKTESQWTKKNERELARRAKKAEEMKAMGYDYQAPDLKSPSEVLEQAVVANGVGDKETSETLATDTKTQDISLEAGEGQSTSNPDLVQGTKQKRQKKSKKPVVDVDGAEQPAPVKSKKNRAKQGASSAG